MEYVFILIVLEYLQLRQARCSRGFNPPPPSILLAQIFLIFTYKKFEMKLRK